MWSLQSEEQQLHWLHYSRIKNVKFLDTKTLRDKTETARRALGFKSVEKKNLNRFWKPTTNICIKTSSV